jgi:hypothetical protein
MPFAMTPRIVLAAVVALAAAGLGARVLALTPEPPVISGLSPAIPEPKATVQVLTIAGTGFETGISIEVTDPAGQKQAYSGDQVARPSRTELHASVILPVEGDYSLTATNPDGGTSDPFPLTVKADPKPEPPVITQIRPPDPRPSPEQQTLTVEGRRFETGLRAIVTDPAGVEVTDVNVRNVTPESFELVLRLAMPGDYLVVVSNPAGGVSNTYVLTAHGRTRDGWHSGGRTP